VRCMKNYFSYPWSILYGLYMYVIFHILFLVRFGRINVEVNSSDIFIVLVGIFSVVLLMYFGNKVGDKKKLLLIPFVIAIPFSYMGALGGGLLGPIGMLVFGILPFLITLPIGYVFLKKGKNKENTNIYVGQKSDQNEIN